MFMLEFGAILGFMFILGFGVILEFMFILGFGVILFFCYFGVLFMLVLCLYGILVFGNDGTGPADASKKMKRVQGWSCQIMGAFIICNTLTL